MKKSIKSTIVFALAGVMILSLVVSFFYYDRSESAHIYCYENSYAQTYAEKNKVNYSLIADSTGVFNTLELEMFDYNNISSTYEIVGYKGTSAKVVIPDNIGGVPVISVAKDTFKNNSTVKSIAIPKSVLKFEPEDLTGIVIYCYKDSAVYKTAVEKKFSYVEIVDSDYMNFDTSKINFTYNTSLSGIELVGVIDKSSPVIVPTSISGNAVTSISFPVLSDGIARVVIPESVKTIKSDFSTPRYTTEFYAGMIFVVLGFVLAAAIIIVSSKKDDKSKDILLSIPAMRFGIIYYALQIVWVFVTLFAYEFSALVIIVVSVILMMIYAILTFSVLGAKKAIVETGEKVAPKVMYIKSLQIDIEGLMDKTDDAMLKKAIAALANTVKYSDPMSNDALAANESKIDSKVSELAGMIGNKEVGAAKDACKAIELLLVERNKRVKLLK